MNRIIKFRAWDTENKKMYSCDWLSFIPGGIRFAWVDPNRDEMMITSLKDFELMQFTGLLDKNGKEIYEGDIVNIGFRKITVVTYENGCFLAKYSNSNYRLGGWKVVEIIGNIYESPSLLTPNPTKP